MTSKYLSHYCPKRKRTVLDHRQVWEDVHGPIPPGMDVDHINRNRKDNRIENLRLLTRQHNLQNSVGHSDAAVPYKGVSRHRGRFTARIGVNYKQMYLGSFDTAEQAFEAYKEAAKRLHACSPYT